VFWPLKTIIKFVDGNGREQRLCYAVSARSSDDAQDAIKSRLFAHEIFGFTVEQVVAATVGEAREIDLPTGCVQLLA
jgi:hypothetical protein